MNEEKKSLGRGLDSLLGERAERSTQGVLEVPLEDLVPGQYQPRNKMHKDTPVSYTHLTLPTIYSV